MTITAKYGATRQCLARLIADITDDAYAITPRVRAVHAGAVSRALLDKLAGCGTTELWAWCKYHQAVKGL